MTAILQKPVWQTWRGAVWLVALTGLAACAQPAVQETEGGVIAETDADFLARTGVPQDAVIAEDGYSGPEADGTTRKFVQVYGDRVTAAQIAAAPAALCAGQGLEVVSSQVGPPGPADLSEAGSLVIRVICK